MIDLVRDRVLPAKALFSLALPRAPSVGRPEGHREERCNDEVNQGKPQSSRSCDLNQFSISTDVMYPGEGVSVPLGAARIW